MSDKPSASLAQARELYNLLIEIDQKLVQTESSAKKAELSYSDLYNVLQDVFVVIKEMGLPEDIENGVMLIHRMIMAMNSLRMAMIALNAATMTTPAGLALAGLGFAVSMFSTIGGIQSSLNMRQRW